MDNKKRTSKTDEVRFKKGKLRLPEGVDCINRTVGKRNDGFAQVLVALHLASSCGQQFFCSFPFFRITGHADAQTKLHQSAGAH